MQKVAESDNMEEFSLIHRANRAAAAVGSPLSMLALLLLANGSFSWTSRSASIYGNPIRLK